MTADLKTPAEKLDGLLWEAIDYAAAHPAEAREVDPMTWHHLLTYSTYTPSPAEGDEPACWIDSGDLEQLAKLGMGGVLGWPDNGNDPRRVPLYTRPATEPHDSRGPTTLEGWRSAALDGEKERDWLRERLRLITRHQEKDCWYWQNDGEDHLESMTNALPVVIRADHLRALLANVQPKGTTSRALAARACTAMWRHMPGVTPAEMEKAQGELEAMLAVATATALTADDLELCRQWFCSVHDLNEGHLERADFVLAEKLYRALRMRVPGSIADPLGLPASDMQFKGTPAGFALVPIEPTPEMLDCIAYRRYPEDWEAGKLLQRNQRGDNRIPLKTEYEMAAGQWQRLLAAAPSAPSPAPAPDDKALTQALEERDAASDYIDALLDEVLGKDRHEWTSNYGHADAMAEVRERMATVEGLEKAVAAGFPVVARWTKNAKDGAPRARVWVQFEDGGPEVEFTSDLQAPAVGADENLALDLLETLFDAYENGPACYSAPDEEAGFIGNAVQLSHEDFQACADLLNRRRPRTDSQPPVQGSQS